MKTNLICAVAILFSNLAHAGVFIEPYVGYGIGKSTGDASVTAPIASTQSATADYSGMSFGGKLGPSIMILAFGADVMMSSGKIKDTNSSDDFKDTSIGAFVGINLPMVKASATYFISSKGTSTDSSGLETKTTGNGIKVGIGYSGLPLIAINLDYIALSYDKAETPGITFASYSAKHTITMLGLSLPFDF